MLLIAGFAWSEPQLISLRHPESGRDQHRTSREGLPSEVPEQPSRLAVKPGNVVVHLDGQHKIQQLEYMVHDGRLVTLFQRHPDNSSNT